MRALLVSLTMVLALSSGPVFANGWYGDDDEGTNITNTNKAYGGKGGNAKAYGGRGGNAKAYGGKGVGIGVGVGKGGDARSKSVSDADARSSSKAGAAAINLDKSRTYNGSESTSEGGSASAGVVTGQDMGYNGNVSVTGDVVVYEAVANAPDLTISTSNDCALGRGVTGGAGIFSGSIGYSKAERECRDQQIVAVGLMSKDQDMMNMAKTLYGALVAERMKAYRKGTQQPGTPSDSQRANQDAERN